MRPAVVVTGASTGIGEATVRWLADRGFRAFGTVRRPEDAERLRLQRVEPLLLDVTDGASIARARQRLAAALEGQGLFGLVNNAGIAAAGPLEFVPLEEFRQVLEVNLIGLLAVTQALLPLLRRARGRIVNVSSISGRIAMPFAGPYVASKFALEGLSDALRRELAGSGVTVVVVEPASVRTPIWDKVARLDLGRYGGTPYAPFLPLVRQQALAGAARGLPPEAVARAIARALTARRAPRRIVVVKHPWRFRLLRLLPDWVLDRAAAAAFRRARAAAPVVISEKRPAR